jgi:hypothetical protein
MNGALHETGLAAQLQFATNANDGAHPFSLD